MSDLRLLTFPSPPKGHAIRDRNAPFNENDWAYVHELVPRYRLLTQRDPESARNIRALVAWYLEHHGV